MFYLSHEEERIFAAASPEDRDRELRKELAALTPALAADRRAYRHFGPYWWWIKPLVRTVPTARRSWLRGGFLDRAFLQEVAEAPPGQRESSLRIAWLGLHYYRAEALDETPAAMHIVDRRDGTAFVYRVYDADASEQMELFAEGGERKELKAFLADPVLFSGSAWLQQGDRYAAQGDLPRAAAALRRAAERAVSDDDRTSAWIRLGQLFQEHRHTAKAILCYHNAWERDREGWIQGLIAEAYLENDQPHLALECYQSALRAMPGNPEYQAGLERCRRLTREGDNAYLPAAEPPAG